MEFDVLSRHRGQRIVQCAPVERQKGGPAFPPFEEEGGPYQQRQREGSHRRVPRATVELGVALGGLSKDHPPEVLKLGGGQIRQRQRRGLKVVIGTRAKVVASVVEALQPGNQGRLRVGEALEVEPVDGPKQNAEKPRPP
eukprot:scaffold2516_cov108-Isochrysis_galbana.AAC.19